MSTTLVETSPVWVYKLFSENSNPDRPNSPSSPPTCKSKILKDSEESHPIKQFKFDTEHSVGHVKCSARNAVNGRTPFGGCSSFIRTARTTATQRIMSERQSADSGGSSCDRGHHRLAFICNFLERAREPLATYQEKKGIPRDSQFTFIGLMTTLFQATYHAVITIIAMLIQILPILEGMLYFGRFFVDKCLEICNTERLSCKIVKIFLFIGELIVISFLMSLMMLLVILPIWHLCSNIFAMVWATVYSAFHKI